MVMDGGSGSDGGRDVDDEQQWSSNLMLWFSWWCCCSLRETRNGDGDAERMPLGSTMLAVK
jgi:hypothetical protein